MALITLLGMGDVKTRKLRDNLDQALSTYPVNWEIQEISEINQIMASGVSTTPALMIDHALVSEGEVLEVGEIVSILKRRFVYRTKLHHLKNILVPSDFSDTSSSALEYAAFIANKVGATIDLVHCADPMMEVENSMLNGVRSKWLKTWQNELMEQAKKVSDKVDASLPGVPLQIRTSVLSGYPEAQLIQLSEKSDLLVMGTTGKSNWADVVFGKVSVEVAKEAHCPVLLVPPSANFKGLNDIVYAANYESLDAHKISEVVDFASKFNSKVHFLHISPEEEVNSPIEKKLFEIHYQYAGGKHGFRFQNIKSNDVIGAINRYAEMIDADMIVFITQSRSFGEELYHPSMTKKMHLHAHLPLLVVHQHNDVIGTIS